MELTTALLWYGVITLVLLLLEINYTYLTKGLAYGWSAKRENNERSGLGLRVRAIYQNQIESAAYIVPALVGGALVGLEGAGVAWAAVLILVGRVLFAGLYLTGISFVRLPGFLLALISSIFLIVKALMAT